MRNSPARRRLPADAQAVPERVILGGERVPDLGQEPRGHVRRDREDAYGDAHHRLLVALDSRLQHRWQGEREEAGPEEQRGRVGPRTPLKRSWLAACRRHGRRTRAMGSRPVKERAVSARGPRRPVGCVVAACNRDGCIVAGVGPRRSWSVDAAAVSWRMMLVWHHGGIVSTGREQAFFFLVFFAIPLFSFSFSLSLGRCW